MAKLDWTQEELRQLLQEYEANKPDPRVSSRDFFSHLARWIVHWEERPARSGSFVTTRT